MNIPSGQTSREVSGLVPAAGDARLDGATSDIQDLAAHPVFPQRRSFAGMFLASFLAVYLAALLVNWLGNASRCFVSPWCPSHSDRAWKTRRLERLVRSEGAPQILILGSSRVMQMSPDYVTAITGKRAFNYAAINGNIVDCLAEFRYSLQIGAKPEVLIFDVNAFDSDITGGQLYLAGHAGLLRSVPFLEKSKIFAGIVQQVNIRNTQRSILAIIRALVKGPPADGQVLEDGEIVILKDGYRFNRELTMAKANGTFDLSVVLRDRILQERASESHPRGRAPSNTRWLEYFRDLLDMARSSGVEVYVVATPLQPEFEAALAPEAKLLHDELVRTLKSECRQFGFQFRDFSNLASFGGDPEEFWDSVHQTPVNMRRMTNVLFGIDREKTVAHLPTDMQILQRLSAGNSQ